VTHRHAAADVLQQGDAGGRLRQLGHHEVALPHEPQLVVGVLRPDLGALRAPQRLVEREVISLHQRDPAVAVCVTCAAQRADEVVREERPAHAVRLLRELVGGRAGHIGVAAHLAGHILQERGLADAALAAHQGARRTGVHDRHAHVRGQTIETRSQIDEVETGRAQQQPLLVRVPGVEEHQLGPLPGCPRRGQASGQDRKGLVHALPGGVGDQHLRRIRDAPEPGQHLSEPLPVGVGPAQGLAALAPLVGGDEQREPRHAFGARRSGEGPGRRGRHRDLRIFRSSW
jgi:hypothetical protein